MENKGKGVARREIAAEVNRLMQKHNSSMKRQDHKLLNIGLGSGTNFTSFSYDAGIGFMYPDSFVTPGTGITNRVGNEIRQRKLEWKFAIAPGDDYNVCRFLVLRTKAVTTGSGATLSSQVFSGNTGALSILQHVDPMLFDVLHDETFVAYKRPLDGSTSASVSLPHITVGAVPLDNLITYGQSTGTAGRRIVMVFASDSAAIPNPGCVAGSVRYTWTDS